MSCARGSALAVVAVLLGSCAHKWVELHPAAPLPEARWQHRAAYEPASNRLIVYSGKIPATDFTTDVWVLEHANGLGGTPTWTKLAVPGAAPTARHMTSLAYDEANDRMIICGGHVDAPGAFSSDVWVLEHATGVGGASAWTQLMPSGAPPAKREWHTAVYDGGSNRMTVFGGLAVGEGLVNDVWVLEHANSLAGSPAWIRLAPSGAAPARRAGHTAVFDRANDRMIVFGGGNGSECPCLNDVWVLLHANGLGGTPEWVQLKPTGQAPINREDHTAVYDGATNRMIVFGGWRTEGPSAFYLNDVWVLKNANGIGGAPEWVRMKTKGSPPSARELASAVYDPGSGRMVVFGGSFAPVGPPTCGSGACANDLWLLKK